MREEKRRPNITCVINIDVKENLLYTWCIFFFFFLSSFPRGFIFILFFSISLEMVWLLPVFPFSLCAPEQLRRSPPMERWEEKEGGSKKSRGMRAVFQLDNPSVRTWFSSSLSFPSFLSAFSYRPRKKKHWKGEEPTAADHA